MTTDSGARFLCLLGDADGLGLASRLGFASGVLEVEVFARNLASLSARRDIKATKDVVRGASGRLLATSQPVQAENPATHLRGTGDWRRRQRARQRRIWVIESRRRCGGGSSSHNALSATSSTLRLAAAAVLGARSLIASQLVAQECGLYVTSSRCAFDAEVNATDGDPIELCEVPAHPRARSRIFSLRCPLTICASTRPCTRATTTTTSSRWTRASSSQRCRTRFRMICVVRHLPSPT